MAAVTSQPKLSIKQAAEFAADPNDAPRRAIIRRAKRPIGTATNRYRKFGQTIRGFLLDQHRDENTLFALEHEYLEALDRLELLDRQADPTPEQANEIARERNEVEACRDVLFRFMAMYRNSPLPSYTFHRARRLQSFGLSGIRVALRLDLVVRGELDGQQAMGGLVFQFSRALKDEIRQAMAIRVAALISYGLGQSMIGKQSPDLFDRIAPELCLCVDAPAQRVVSATSAHLPDVLAEVKGACAVARKMWNHVPPP